MQEIDETKKYTLYGIITSGIQLKWVLLINIGLIM